MKNLTTSAKSLRAIAFSVTFIAIGLSGCNTVEGAGQDIKSTGKAIEKAADKNK